MYIYWQFLYRIKILSGRLSNRELKAVVKLVSHN